MGHTRLLLGTDFMEPAGVRLDLAEGTACLPNEVKLRLEGRRQHLYSDKCRSVVIEDSLLVPIIDT